VCFLTACGEPPSADDERAELAELVAQRYRSDPECIDDVIGDMSDDEVLFVFDLVETAETGGAISISGGEMGEFGDALGDVLRC
jgi:hypothetical protein